MYFLTVCEEISHSLTGSSAWLQSRGWPGLCSLKTLLGKDLPPGSHGCWTHSVPCRKSDWGPQFFAGTLSSLLHGPLHRLAYNIATCFIQPARKCKMSVAMLCNIITQVTYCHCCLIVLEASYWSFPHTGWRDLYAIMTTRRQGLLRDIL